MDEDLRKTSKEILGSAVLAYAIMLRRGSKRMTNSWIAEFGLHVGEAISQFVSEKFNKSLGVGRPPSALQGTG